MLDLLTFLLQVLGFENLVFAIFEFVHALVETPKFKGAVKSGLSELMYYIVLYMQVYRRPYLHLSDDIIVLSDHRGAVHKVERESRQFRGGRGRGHLRLQREDFQPGPADGAQ